jgi:hypothetical protein
MMYQDLLHLDKGCQEGIPPYILGIKSYPLLTRIRVPHKKGQHTILEALFNRKHKQEHSMIENDLGILKQTFHELQGLRQSCISV